MGALGKVQCDRIAACGNCRIRGDVDAKPNRRREFREESQQDAAGAAAEIEKPLWRLTVKTAPQHGLDDRLGFGPWIERVGRQSEFQTPEFAVSENAAQRLMINHPAQGKPNKISASRVE